MLIIKANIVPCILDEELPDYIMVLVANKKTKDQMDDDLSLFLGHNTERFTSWLHHVLQKLNAAALLQGTASSTDPGRAKGEYFDLENSQTLSYILLNILLESCKIHIREKQL